MKSKKGVYTLNNKILLIKSSEEYFLTELELAEQKLGFKTNEELKVYILKLLSNQLLQNNELDLNKPLAISFLEAFNEDQNSCARKLKNIGDYVLYIAGYFSESLNKKIIDIDYYNKLGVKAYAELYNLLGESGAVYYSLCTDYYKLLDLLMEISFKTMQTDTKNLIKLYDRWLVTGSNVLEKKLNEKGIITEERKIKVA